MKEAKDEIETAYVKKRGEQTQNQEFKKLSTLVNKYNAVSKPAVPILIPIGQPLGSPVAPVAPVAPVVLLFLLFMLSLLLVKRLPLLLPLLLVVPPTMEAPVSEYLFVVPHPYLDFFDFLRVPLIS